VITGKGRSNQHNQQYFMAGQEPETGVLRRLTPLWLEEPQLRMFVASHSPAAPRHGGEGALYIRLRRQRQPG